MASLSSWQEVEGVVAEEEDTSSTKEEGGRRRRGSEGGEGRGKGGGFSLGGRLPAAGLRGTLQRVLGDGYVCPVGHTPGAVRQVGLAQT